MGKSAFPGYLIVSWKEFNIFPLNPQEPGYVIPA
jgi:hypothetical protein